jgi:hypothetical protein
MRYWQCWKEITKKLKILSKNWGQCFGLRSSEPHKHEDGLSSVVLPLLRAEHLEIDLHVHVWRTSTWHLTGETTPLGHKPTTNSNIAIVRCLKFLFCSGPFNKLWTIFAPDVFYLFYSWYSSVIVLLFWNWFKIFGIFGIPNKAVFLESVKWEDEKPSRFFLYLMSTERCFWM